MQRSIYKKGFGKSKQQAAAAAVKLARATILSSRRGPVAPIRTGGFFGVSNRRGRQELKVVDVDTTASNIISTPTVALLNGVAAGTDFTDRIGRKIVMKSLYFRAYISPQDAITSDHFIRIAIVYDLQTNGTATAWTDVFKETQPTSQLNLNNRDRFRILYDKSFCAGSTNNTATQANSNGHNCFFMKKFKPLKHEVIFGGTAATVGSIQTGSIYLLMMSNVATTAGSGLSWSSRVRFYDA